MASPIYRNIHEPPSQEALSRAFSKLTEPEQAIIERCGDHVAKKARHFGPVSARELFAKLGMLVLAKEEYGRGASLLNPRIMAEMIENSDQAPVSPLASNQEEG